MLVNAAPQSSWYQLVFQSLARPSGMRDAVVIVVGATAASVWWSGDLTPPFLAKSVWWTVLAGLFLLLLWQRREVLFGPVFFYEVIRLARRGRYASLRTLYALAILNLLLYMGMWSGLGEAVSVRNQQALARFAESFFLAFMKVQFLAILLLTPAYTAGAIAEEKERKTLEYLFTTCIGGGELVFSKLIARLGNLAMLLLAGVPILALIPLWGGVDPSLVLAGFAASAVTMASLAALSILFSVYAAKARNAIVLTYLMAALYLGLTFLGQYFHDSALVAGVRLRTAQDIFAYEKLFEALCRGNPLLALQDLQKLWQAGAPLTKALFTVMKGYAIFHGCLTLVCVLLAVARAHQMGFAPRRERVRRSRPVKVRARRPMGEFPMLWKELYTGHADLFSRVTGKALFALTAASFLPVLWFWGTRGFGLAVSQYGLPRGDMTDFVTTWVPIEAAFLACLSLIVVALHAAGGISSERDRDTWDGLRTTPLATSEILSAKRLGSIYAARWVIVFLVLTWIIGAFHNGASLWRIPLLLLVSLVYATCAATLGLCLSMRCRTSLRANMETLALAAVLLFGPSLPATVIDLNGMKVWPKGSWQPIVLGWLEHGVAPQSALGWLASPYSDLWRWQSSRDHEIQGILLGLILYLATAGCLGLLTAYSLRKQNPLTKADAPSPEQRARWRRWRRRLIAGATVCLFLGVGRDAVLNMQADRRLQAAIAVIERDDPDWRWQDTGRGGPRVPFTQYGMSNWSLGGPPAGFDYEVGEANRFIAGEGSSSGFSWLAESNRLSSIHFGTEVLEAVLARHELTQRMLAWLQQELQDPNAQDMLNVALRSARGAIDHELHYIREGKRPLGSTASIATASSGWAEAAGGLSWLGIANGFGNERQRFLAPGYLNNQRANFLDYLTRLEAISRLPLEDQVLAIERMEPLGVDPALIRAAALNEIIPSLGQLQDLLREHYRMQANLRCAIVMVAVERYRGIHFRWPETLTELVPEQLLRIPLDPYSGRYIGYRRLADGVVIYSVGPYGKNDGSNPLQQVTGPSNTYPMGSRLITSTPVAGPLRLGFRLWDVKRRVNGNNLAPAEPPLKHHRPHG